jgi:hypothetical protein
VAKVIKKAAVAAGAPDGIEDEKFPGLDPLDPDHMRLYSFFKPALEAGLYSVSAKQIISVNSPSADGKPTQTKTVINYDSQTAGASPKKIVSQAFEVVASQFSMDPKLINSYYPPDGHQDEASVLPHMVFNDPHFPWERLAGTTAAVKPDPTEVPLRSVVPWVALVAFDPDELKLTAADALALRVPGFQPDSSGNPPDMTLQPNTGGFPMTVGQYLDTTTGISSRVEYEAGYPVNISAALTEWNELQVSTDPTTVIFPTKKLFSTIFSNPESHKYLSHVRYINTVGFPDAGVEEQGIYSIIMSHRTGPTQYTTPVTQVVHLLSMEHVDSTTLDPTSPTFATDRIGVVSLFSWLYTSLPPDPVNFVDDMEALARTMQMLKPPQPQLDIFQAAVSKTDSGKTIAANLFARLDNGYTISRWRTETGEETAAFNRGPLIPVPTSGRSSKNPDDWITQSMTGKDYQILDPYTGLMDLSYSSAWQLGKVLAIGDGTFSTALTRFRSAVVNEASSNTLMEVNHTQSKKVLLAGLDSHVSEMKKLSGGQTGLPQRITPPSTDSLAPGLTHPDVAPVLTKHILLGVTRRTAAGQDQVFNGFNLSGADNADWAVVHSWITEKLFLNDIPAHYLFSDPTHLPDEALRFFHIDDAWTDALIDGALSVANHLDPINDRVRKQIKELYNLYLRTTISTTDPKTGIVIDTGIHPQIPTWGFVLRSAIVKVMPDLKVTVNWNSLVDHGQAPICKLTRLDEHTVFCLLDRRFNDVDSITLSQPPHQQRFKAGYNITPAGILQAQLKHLYTQNPPVADPKVPDSAEWPTLGDPTPQPSWYKADTRCVDVQIMVQDMTKLIQMDKGLAGVYNDLIPTSVVLGLELNDPSYYLELIPPTTNPTVFSIRQLWTGTSKTFDVPIPPAATSNTSTPLTVQKKAILPTSPPATAVVPSSRLPAPIGASPLQTKPQATAPVPTTAPSASAIKVPQLPHSIPPRAAFVTTVPVIQAASANVQPQFNLIVHPDYKLPPPKAIRGVHDPNDFVPILANYLFDLVFSVQRITPNQVSQYQLVELNIDIPWVILSSHPAGISSSSVSAAGPPGLRAAVGAAAVEPLLKGDYDGPGITMLGFQRFTPMINKSTGFLTCRIIPRSAASSPVMVLTDLKSRAASFSLGAVRIADIQTIKPIDIQAPGGKVQRVAGGVATVYLHETYLVGGAMQTCTSTFDVVKRNIGDVDLMGVPV